MRSIFPKPPSFVVYAPLKLEETGSEIRLRGPVILRVIQHAVVVVVVVVVVIVFEFVD